MTAGRIMTVENRRKLTRHWPKLEHPGRQQDLGQTLTFVTRTTSLQMGTWWPTWACYMVCCLDVTGDCPDVTVVIGSVDASRPGSRSL